MKLSDDMLFGHPVLAPETDDFRDSIFDASFDVDIDGDRLTVSANIRLDCPELDELLDEGAAGCGFYLICRATYQNRLIEMSPGKASHNLRRDGFFGTLQLRPVIWSKEERTGWTSPRLHPEYGGAVDFPAGALLAVGEVQRFSVDRERLKPFESIFSLAKSDEVEPGVIVVDPEQDKITITVHPDTKASIDDIRNDPRGQIVLLNAVYLPAVMQVLTDLATGDKNHEDRAWFRIFEAKCAQCGFDPSNANPLLDAQRLLNTPFMRIDERKEELFK